MSHYSLQNCRLLESIDIVTSRLPLVNDRSKFVRNAFGLAAQRVIIRDFDGVVFNARTTFSTDGSKTVSDIAASDIKSDLSTSSLLIPASMFSQIRAESFVARINLNTFANSALFQPAEKANTDLKVSSDIISATVEGLVVANLDENDPIVISFQRDDVSH